jgi:hypothetical protein
MRNFMGFVFLTEYYKKYRNKESEMGVTWGNVRGKGKGMRVQGYDRKE